MTAAWPGVSASAPAVTSSETNAKARSGRMIVTLHLDLDDFADPHESNQLHDDGRKNQRAAHRFLEERPHVLPIDDRQGDGEECRQREQDESGNQAVSRVQPYLPLDLEELAKDVGKVVGNLGKVDSGDSQSCDSGQ